MILCQLFVWQFFDTGNNLISDETYKVVRWTCTMRTQNGRDLCKLENAHEDRQCEKRKQE